MGNSCCNQRKTKQGVSILKNESILPHQITVSEQLSFILQEQNKADKTKRRRRRKQPLHVLKLNEDPKYRSILCIPIEKIVSYNLDRLGHRHGSPISFEKTMKLIIKCQLIELKINEEFYALSSSPVVMLSAHQWFAVKVNIVRDIWQTINSDNFCEWSNIYNFLINISSARIWGELNTVSKLNLKEWERLSNLVTLEIIYLRQYAAVGCILPVLETVKPGQQVGFDEKRMLVQACYSNTYLN